MGQDFTGQTFVAPVDFSNSDHSGVGFTDAEFLQNVVMSANFSNSNFADADFSGAVFANSAYFESEAGVMSLLNADFTDAQFLSTSSFMSRQSGVTDLTNADFSGSTFGSIALFFSIDSGDVVMTGADFSHVNFERTVYFDDHLDGANFFGSTGVIKSATGEADYEINEANILAHGGTWADRRSTSLVTSSSQSSQGLGGTAPFSGHGLILGLGLSVIAVCRRRQVTPEK